jgi:Domain of unknown function (DUF3394)
MMAFVAALQGFFFTPNRWWETVLLLLICFTLFRPNFWMDRVIPPYQSLPASQVTSGIDQTKGAGALRVRVATQDMSGDDVVKLLRLNLGQKGTAVERLASAGIILTPGEQPSIASVRPGSEAARQKLRPGDTIAGVEVPTDRPSPFLFAIPAIIVLGALAWLQRRRRAPLAAAA